MHIKTKNNLGLTMMPRLLFMKQGKFEKLLIFRNTPRTF